MKSRSAVLLFTAAAISILLCGCQKKISLSKKDVASQNEVTLEALNGVSREALRKAWGEPLYANSGTVASKGVWKEDLGGEYVYVEASYDADKNVTYVARSFPLYVIATESNNLILISWDDFETLPGLCVCPQKDLAGNEINLVPGEKYRFYSGAVMETFPAQMSVLYGVERLETVPDEELEQYRDILDTYMNLGNHGN